MPFLLISTYTNMGLCYLFRALGFTINTVTYTQPIWLVILLVLIGAAVGMGTRNFIALTQLPPFYMFLLPIMTLVLSFVMVPIRIAGLMKCADGLAWGTRIIEEKQS